MPYLPSRIEDTPLSSAEADGQGVRAGASTPRPSRLLKPTARRLGSLDARHVLGLHPLLALGRLVGNLGALFEGLEPVAGYPGVMDEEVLATFIRGDI
jgi:hypothetical protein